MKYSVIIPTYNHCADLLKPCIESLIKYTDFTTTELVVVANGCTDETKEYIESINIPHKQLLWSDEALGYTKATNIGITHATGDYLALLNNDTEILPSPTNYWLDRLWFPFRDDSTTALTGSLKLRDHDIDKEFIVFCCAMISRDAFNKLGILDEAYSPGYGEDIDFTMRVERAGLKWTCVDETKFIGGTNVGTFPLWHKNNKTFGEMPEYGSVVVARNRRLLAERWGKARTPKYSIVVPTYNHCSDLLEPCLQSITKYSNMDEVEVVVVANGCIDGTRAYVESLGKNFKLVWVDEPIGYTAAANLGIKESTGEYLVLLNNDTVLLEQQRNWWLEALADPFLKDSATGITGTMKFSWDCGGIQRQAMAFWLVMFKRQIFTELGLLDEIFSPGMGEDGDYSIRVTEAGYKLVSVPVDETFQFSSGPSSTPFPIWHKGNGTFADDIKGKDAIIQRNNRILNYRWGMQSKKHIDISIIIPSAHNFERALRPCLEAVLAYTDLSNKEIIVVANGAPSEARDYLDSQTDKLSYIWSDTATGVVKAYNAGIAAAKGKWIVLLDDDSHLMPQPVDLWINILQKPFLTEDSVGASGPFAHEYADMGFVLHSGCTMYRGDLLRKLKFDEAFNPGYFSDPDISMRIWREGYRCVEVPAENPDKPYRDNVFAVQFPVVHLGNVQTMDKNADSELVKRNRDLLYSKYGRNTITPALQAAYDYYCVTPIDIHEHLPTLRKYAKECNHITELGTRFVVSTYAFLAGKPAKMLTYDLYPHPNIWKADQLAKENYIQFGFMERDTTKTTIEPTDLLFIDTAHNYLQVKKELELHAEKAKKYIIFHDTVSYGYIDEDGSPGGLWPAINEWLAANPHWVIKENFTNCNGLLVCERVGVPSTEVQHLPRNASNRAVKYSIVIPTYNHLEDLLKPCIESIKRYSTLDNLEVIVVANGCVDDTRNYVESLGSWAKLVWIDEAVGYTKATNEGIRASSGEYIVLLNNDTELLPAPVDTWLHMLEEPLKAEDAGLSGPLELYDRYAASWVLIFFCVMVKRSLFDKIGLLDEIFTPGGGEDIDFTVRANQAGYRSVCITETHYSTQAGTNVGQFPIWHKDNRTFRDIDEYSKVVVKRNGLINCKRYNKAIKLNLGAGGIEYEGYLSVDLYDSRAHITMDITKLDFDDGSVEEILASHVFEHLNPYHALDILRDWLRVLKPGGKLIMEMPDIEQLCKRFVTASTGERYGILNAIYGSVNTTGEGGPDNITSPHLFGWWPQSLWDHLTNAGFTNIVFMDEKIPHPESNLRVEAEKPL